MHREREREGGIEDEKPEKYRKELTVNTARAKKKQQKYRRNITKFLADFVVDIFR